MEQQEQRFFIIQRSVVQINGNTKMNKWGEHENLEIRTVEKNHKVAMKWTHSSKKFINYMAKEPVDRMRKKIFAIKRNILFQMAEDKEKEVKKHSYVINRGLKSWKVMESFYI